ncbi:glycosyl hydrolase 108 family protein [Sphingomonas sp. AR_OL41]|uniref:glycosyl hydrolase 108 family protein n=1 Tax=Sphingomonas sp. AR_OL41 TaxID=3042729 RepID=UPI0024802449|nr:glycosyl hydrolase 108 family protein [Sphingomonas sp. AR_OL41]MDH7971759.1 glycosyl hydrolase 108 family protein [Sphingomonas sp. AR_OL41]
MTPKEFIAGFIGTHEGKLSLHASDNGNWYDPVRYKAEKPQRRNMGQLVGSKFGVTAYALVRYRIRKGMPEAQALVVKPADIDAIDFAMAVDIGIELYFKEPGFDTLPWNRVTASIVDKGWGSGPGAAVDMMQATIGASTKGGIGPETRSKYAAFLAAHGEQGAAILWCNTRCEFDHNLATNEGPNDPDKAFINGWNNRSRSFLPGTPWWQSFGA